MSRIERAQSMIPVQLLLEAGLLLIESGQLQAGNFAEMFQLT